MVPNSNSSFISKELGFNIYSLKISAKEKFIVLRPARLIGRSYFTGFPTCINHHTAVITVDEDYFIIK